MLREIFLYFCQSEYFNLPSKRRRGKSTFTVLLASYLHYTLRHDVLVVDATIRVQICVLWSKRPLGAVRGAESLLFRR